MSVEPVFTNLQKKLLKTDPRHDLLVNTFEAYQSTAIAMKTNEQGKGESPDALTLIVAASSSVRFTNSPISDSFDFREPATLRTSM